MLKKLKQIYYNWKYKNIKTNQEIYVVAMQPDESRDLIKIISIHSTLKAALKAREKEAKGWIDKTVDVRRYGLWTD